MWNETSSIPVVNTPHPSGRKKYDSNDGSINPDSTGDDTNNTLNQGSSILHCIIAGGTGGLIGDTAMHSLDTVKTRQQGAPNIRKYRNMIQSYKTIILEEGVRRGLYSGYSAAMLGSFPSAAIFFGTYEFTKRKMINDWGVNETASHLVSGFLGDFVSSFAYVPSEVLKTRLQLQGKYNNEHFFSGYNYRNLKDAISTIVKTEGSITLFHGYKATLARDLPFSALQFAFYEKFRRSAYRLDNKKRNEGDLSLTLEIVTGAAAGGLAGIITTPCDVVKTRLQTQQSGNSTKPTSPTGTTAAKKPPTLSNSILKSLRVIYQSEGVVGLFSGVGPRFVWTSVQSSIMLLLYQVTLKALRNTNVI